MSAVLINKRIYPFLWKTIVLSTNKRWQVRARGIIIIIISETRNGNRSQKRKKKAGWSLTPSMPPAAAGAAAAAERARTALPDAGRRAGAANRGRGGGEGRHRAAARAASAEENRSAAVAGSMAAAAAPGLGRGRGEGGVVAERRRYEDGWTGGESVWCVYYRALSPLLPTPGSSCSSCPQMGAVTAATSRFFLLLFLQRSHQPDFARAKQKYRV
jgi:hypothetical protein